MKQETYYCDFCKKEMDPLMACSLDVANMVLGCKERNQVCFVCFDIFVSRMRAIIKELRGE